MRDLIIGKDIAYAAKTGGGTVAGNWEIDSLTDGGIAIVDRDGALIAHNAASITSKYVELITKTSTGSKRSFPLYTGKTTYSKLEYSAPVAKIMALGSEEASSAGNNSLNLPSTISVGDVFGIGVSDNSLPFEDTRRFKEYTVTAISGDVLTGTGSSNIITKLVAKINADSKAIVTAVAHEDASSNNDGIKFTANTEGVGFNLYHLDGKLKDADISVITDGETGHGTYDHIEKLWKATASRDGNNQYMKYNDLLNSGSNQLVAATTYTTYVFTTEVPNTDQISASVKPKLTLVIAVPSGSSAVIAAIDNLGANIV